MFERADQRLWVELGFSASGAGLARGGDGAVGESFYEVLDDELFVLGMVSAGSREGSGTSYREIVKTEREISA